MGSFAWFTVGDGSLRDKALEALQTLNGLFVGGDGLGRSSLRSRACVSQSEPIGGAIRIRIEHELVGNPDPVVTHRINRLPGGLSRFSGEEQWRAVSGGKQPEGDQQQTGMTRTPIWRGTWAAPTLLSVTAKRSQLSLSSAALHLGRVALLEDVLQHFLKDVPPSSQPVTSAYVAGPVSDGSANSPTPGCERNSSWPPRLARLER